MIFGNTVTDLQKGTLTVPPRPPLTWTHSALKPPGPRIAWTYLKRVANTNYGFVFLSPTAIVFVMFTVAILQRAAVKHPNIMRNPKLAHILVLVYM